MILRKMVRLVPSEFVNKLLIKNNGLKLESLSKQILFGHH